MIFKNSIKSLVAAALQWLAVYLVTKGITDEQSANAFVNGTTELLVGLVLAVGALLWSVGRHYLNKVVILEALHAPPPSPSSVVDIKDTVSEIKSAAVDIVIEKATDKLFGWLTKKKK